RNRNNVVLSRRKYLEEAQSEGRKDFLHNLKKGERKKGTVSSIVNFGAFVDLGGVDGLVHVSELSWRHVEHPSEVVAVGEEVDVEVLDVDMERERVSLSLKATQADPWKEFESGTKPGQVIEGEVTKIVPFGAFVRVAQGIEGLVHISKLSEEHVETADQVVQVGEKVRVKVEDVDVSRRRVSLSMRSVDEVAVSEPEIAAEVAPETPPVPEPEPTPQPEPEPAPVPEPAAEAPAEAPAEVEPEPEAEPEAPEEAEGDVSLESIVADLKRREGRK
ncbi:MAG: S1 RNA-binding domain-containing protein, partial [Actinomycetota bacterium]